MKSDFEKGSHQTRYDTFMNVFGILALILAVFGITKIYDQAQVPQNIWYCAKGETIKVCFLSEYQRDHYMEGYDTIRWRSKDISEKVYMDYTQ